MMGDRDKGYDFNASLKDILDKMENIDTSVRETIGKMENKLKYPINQSTPTSSHYDNVSSPDSGHATRCSDSALGHEGGIALTCDHDLSHIDREQSYQLDHNYGATRTPSPHGGARQKVRFASGQPGKESDYRNLPPNCFKPSAHVGLYPLEADVRRTFDTSRKSKDNKVAVKPATYDGSSSWLDYKCHFEACASVNGWNEETKGLFLALSLRGHAQSVLGDLPTDRGQHYQTLVRSLQERFSPPNQTDLYRVQLKERRQRAMETLSELGQAIRRLTNLAYPTAPEDDRETLAKDQFIDALIDSGIHIHIKNSRPVNLNEAISLAVELEAYNLVEKRNKEVRENL